MPQNATMKPTFTPRTDIENRMTKVIRITQLRRSALCIEVKVDEATCRLANKCTSVIGLQSLTNTPKLELVAYVQIKLLFSIKKLSIDGEIDKQTFFSVEISLMNLDTTLEKAC